MKQLFYKIIYNEKVNLLLRNLNFLLIKIFSKAMRIHRSGILSITNRNKRILLRTNQTNYVTFLIFWKGYEQFEYSPIFIDLVPRISNFYDIGANIGYYSILASSINPKMKITSFEPAIGPHYYLEKNVAINKMENIQIENIALSDITGEIEFTEVSNPKYKYLKYILSGEGNTGSKKFEIIL